MHAATFAAAFFQSVTGVGFGMIAGPVILVVLHDPSAVVLSSAMSWLIALCLFPWLWRGSDPQMLRRLLLGAALGIVPGVILLSAVDVVVLKAIAGLTIATLTTLIVFGAPGAKRPGAAGDMVAGGLGGLFGGALAMPGPTAAVRMNGLSHSKARVRATMVAFFVLVWPMILLAQWVSLGISAETAWNALKLVPGTLAGLAVGNYAASRVSEDFFRRIVLVLLTLTAASLLGTAVWDWIGGRE
ncbi:MAG: TSUP family transporter [Pseudomonadota bacterium]